MSDAETLLPEGDDKRYVALMIGPPSEESYGDLTRMLRFWGKLLGGDIAILQIDVDRYFYGGGINTEHGLERYLLNHLQLLSPSVVVCLVHATSELPADTPPVLSTLLRRLCPDAVFEGFGPDDWRCSDLNMLTIEELELEVRTYNCLKRAGVHTLADLLGQMTESDVKGLPNIGTKGFSELVRVLAARGLSLRAE